MTEPVPATATFELAPAPDARIVGDRLPGRTPGLLFLHGLGSVRAGEKSSLLLRRAAASGRAFARFDFRAHGASSGSLTQVTMSDFVADGEAVLQHVGRSVLIGSSLGGLVAAWLARRIPDLVHALVLIAPAFDFLPRMRVRLAKAPVIRLTDGREIEVQRRFLADAERFDEADLPQSIRTPTFVVHGDADDVVPIEASRRFFAQLASARKELLVVPGGDHRLNREADAIYASMDAFLADVDATTG